MRERGKRKKTASNDVLGRGSISEGSDPWTENFRKERKEKQREGIVRTKEKMVRIRT